VPFRHLKDPRADWQFLTAFCEALDSTVTWIGPRGVGAAGCRGRCRHDMMSTHAGRPVGFDHRRHARRTPHDRHWTEQEYKQPNRGHGSRKIANQGSSGTDMASDLSSQRLLFPIAIEPARNFRTGSSDRDADGARLLLSGKDFLARNARPFDHHAVFGLGRGGKPVISLSCKPAWPLVERCDPGSDADLL